MVGFRLETGYLSFLGLYQPVMIRIFSHEKKKKKQKQRKKERKKEKLDQIVFIFFPIQISENEFVSK